jgi:hypothetical protein
MMWVFVRPSRCGFAFAEADDSTDLEPSENQVYVSSIRSAMKTAGVRCHVLKPTEEKKQITDSDAVVAEMPFGSLVLPKRGTPSARPGSRHRIQIRIEMRVSGRERATERVEEIADRREIG